jgi:tetratricopeptide (TPR) repeat protein
MEQLEGLISNLAAGKGAIVNIVGKAGIGKSRLIAEMKVQPVIDKVLMLEGRASSTGQNLSYHPINNLIRSWAGITEDDLPPMASEKLFQGIKHNTPEQADEIYAFVATMMGLPLEGKYKERVKGIEGEALEKLILKNLRDLIIAATKDKPRIYLIEDMHWSDSSSLAMFESLYKLSLNHPVMFINVLRPGYKETGDYILKYLVDNFPGDHSTISVSSLKETDSEQLIYNLLRKLKLPEETEKMIIRKTEGNPFFIEEVIRSFIDEGIIEIHGNDFRVTEKINQASIPETINEVILSRVDKLDEKTKELLKTASVIGRNFYFKVLEEAADTIGELDERLQYLKDVQLIGESKKKDEIEYLFKHALAQQATYESIVMNTKKEMHLKIARSIEKVFAENLNEFYATLAHHYEMAGNKEKTEEYLLKAGDEAMKSGASSEALRFFETTLESLPETRKKDPHDIEIKNLRIKIGFMYQAVGRNQEAVNLFESIFEQYFNFRWAKTNSGILLRGVSSMFATIFIFNNQSLYFKKPLDNFAETLFQLVMQKSYAQSLVNPKHFVLNGATAGVRFRNYDIRKSKWGLHMYTGYAGMLVWAGFSYNTSRKILAFVKKYGVENDPHLLVSYSMSKVMLDCNTGNWQKNEDFKRVYQKGVSIGELWQITVYVLYYGFQQIELGDVAILKEASDIFGEIADSFENWHARSNKYRFAAYGMMKFRKFDQLQEFIDEGKKHIKGTENKTHLFVLNLVQAQLNIYSGQSNEAVAAIKAAEKNLQESKQIPVLYGHYLITKIQLDLEFLKAQKNNGENDKGKLKEILAASNKLIKTSRKYVGNLTEAYLLRSRMFYLKENFKKALKNLSLAISTGEKYNGRLELSRAYFETGKFLSDPNNKFTQLNGISAAEYLNKARTLFEEMDLQWDLAKLERFLEN